jgi:uncharacterized surface anchored protein
MIKKMKSGSKKIMVVFLIFTIFQTLLPFNIALAEEVPFQFFAQVSLTDGDGNPFSGTVEQNEEVNIRYDYSIPDEYTVDTSKTYTLTIPNEIEITSAFSIDLYDYNEDPVVLIATVSVGTDNIISIDFTDNVNNKMYDRTGWFQMELSFDEDEITDQTEITFPLGAGATTVIQIAFEPDEQTVDVDLNKSGEYDKETNEITWQITVSLQTEPDVRPISNLVVSDAIPSDQEYIANSFEILPAGTLGNFNYDAVSNSISYSFTNDVNLSEGEQYTITFKTKADTSLFTTEDGTVQYSNQASSTFDEDGSSLSNTATVSTKVDFIKKTGEYLPDTRQIKWTITINNNYLSIDNAVISDTIQSGLTLEEDSITLDDASISITPSGPLTYVGTTLTYAFDSQINEPHTLIYLTDVTDPDAYNSNTSKTYSNSATLTGDGVTVTDASNGVDVGVPTSVISKKGLSYDYTTHEITWEITVNSNEINIEDPIVTDNIPVGLEYVDNSFLVDGSAPGAGSFSYTPADSGDATKSGSFTYTFPSDISDTVKLTFKTAVLSNTVYASNANTKFTNKASLWGSNIPSSDTTADYTVHSQVLDKTSLNYNYNTREITWQIVVNKNNMPMGNVYIVDTIGEHQGFVAGSVTINGVPAIIGATEDTLNSYYYDGVSGTLRYNFPQEITTQQVIEFKTKITDLSIFETTEDIEVSNSVAITGSDVPPGITSTATQDIANTLISKTGEYETGKAYIDWTVTVNQNKLTIADAVLKDVLQEGLSLDAQSIELWTINLPDNGEISLVNAQQVEITSDNISYDIATNTFIFSFIEPISDVYILKFRTDIDDDHRDATFTNSIQFAGSGIDENSTSSSIPVSFLAGSGGAAGTVRGNLTVVKVDADNTQQVLSGAQFELLDIYGNVLDTSEITGQDGEALFSSLRLDRTYYIKEIIAPVGYVLDESLHEIGGLSDEAGSSQNIMYTFENEKSKGTIRIIKTSKTGIYLTGAEFMLYAGNDTNFENPLATATSNNLGEATFEDVVYGSYKVIETKAPDGYELNTDVMEFTIEEDGQVLSKICINEELPPVLPQTGQDYSYEVIGFLVMLLGSVLLLNKKSNA